jgi:hypothetical protein
MELLKVRAGRVDASLVRPLHIPLKYGANTNVYFRLSSFGAHDLN